MALMNTPMQQPLDRSLLHPSLIPNQHCPSLQPPYFENYGSTAIQNDVGAGLVTASNDYLDFGDLPPPLSESEWSTLELPLPSNHNMSSSASIASDSNYSNEQFTFNPYQNSDYSNDQHAFDLYQAPHFALNEIAFPAPMDGASAMQ